MPRRLIIDTNLLLLLVIGAVEEGKHIRNSKRLNAFNIYDYDNVVKIIKDFDEIYITPYIATEVSNLIDLNGSAKIHAYSIAKTMFCDVFKKIEVNIDVDCNSKFFPLFGLTDSSLIKLASDYFILTCDYRLLEPLYKMSPNTIIPFVINSNMRK